MVNNTLVISCIGWLLVRLCLAVKRRLECKHRHHVRFDYMYDIEYGILRLSSDYNSSLRMLKNTIPAQSTMMMFQHQNDKLKVAMMCPMKSVP
jgi:hypothetical protein